MFALALAGSMGCDSGKSDNSGNAGTSCKKDGDCKNGFLCEADTCVPEAVAKAARGAGSAKGDSEKAADPAAIKSAEETAGDVAPDCGDKSKVPAIASDDSDPPKLTEWDKACEVNTQGAGSQPSDCTMRVLREWLQVTCRGDYGGFEKMENFGKEGFDFFKQIQAGSLVSFVMKLKSGRNQKIRICGREGRASLFVSWPGAQDRPLHIALAKGPHCDGSQWGSQ
jgi:hypothetical protein